MVAYTKKGEYRVSNNCAIVIKGELSDSLFIRANYTIPASSLKTLIDDGYFKIVRSNVKLTIPSGGINIPICNNDEYTEYQFVRPLKETAPEPKSENDCLNFAEFLAAETHGVKDSHEIFPYKFNTSMLQSKDTKNQFGYSKARNRQLLKRIPMEKKNHSAVPNDGEAYAVVRTSDTPDESEYHIAFVIYTHEDINVTLEAAALPQEDSREEVLPQFSFYERNPGGTTFHSVVSVGYQNGQTIVLEARNTETVVSEIQNELAPKQRKRKANTSNNAERSVRLARGGTRKNKKISLKTRSSKR
jgi:hypothetical protein